jgi:hypothetical protein
MESEEQVLRKLFQEKKVFRLAYYFFGIKLSKNQCRIVKEIVYGEHKRVSIVCPTRYGKSYSVSIGILLWIWSHENKKIAIIAPTNEKTTIIRNHIAYFVTKCPLIYSLLDVDKKGQDKIKKEVSRRRMTWKNGIEMRTLSAEGNGEQLMGFGADLTIVDETCDIAYEVYRARITRMLGDNPDSVYIEIGNPWHRDNHFWQHWIDPNYEKIHIGWQEALEEGRITKEFLEEQRGQLTPREFQVLYDANFPETAEDQLIDWDWIERATKQQFDFKGQIWAGLDVAEQGNDSTVFTVGFYDKEFHRFRILAIEHWEKQDLMPTVGKVLALIDKWNVNRIQVDANGIGNGVYSRLQELRFEGRIKCDVIAFKGGMSADSDRDKERFLNIKAQAYWQLRSLFEEGKIGILNDRQLVFQLNHQKWELTSAMKIRIRDAGEKEGDTAEKKSPDFADSLNLMCFEGKTPFMMASLMKPKEKKYIGATLTRI